MEIVLYALVGILYAGLTAQTLQRVFRLKTVGHFSPTDIQNIYGEQSILFIALVIHSVLLHETVFSDQGFRFGFATAISAMVWLGACVFWIERFFLNLSGLGILVFPLACLGACLPLLTGLGHPITYVVASLPFKLHFLIANAAYGLLSLAALHAVLMMTIDNHLHPQRRKHLETTSWFSRWLESMPALLTLEHLLFQLLWAGFICLSLTVMSGAWYSEQLFGQTVRWDHKTVFTLISWVQFAVLLIGRWRQGWRGRTALRSVLVSFVMLMLAYVGSRFVLDVILQR
jgi:ABC-type uncharacterized transport system permease subunit